MLRAQNSIEAYIDANAQNNQANLQESYLRSGTLCALLTGQSLLSF